MPGTWISRFWLELAQELDIGHLPTCFIELAAFLAANSVTLFDPQSCKLPNHLSPFAHN
jgi:hypothetical protein